MHNFVSFNHQIISTENAFLSAISSAAFYGKGIFTTLAVYNLKPFLWEKHWERLNENAGKLCIDLADYSEESVKKSLLEIITENKIINGRVRITFFDESASGVWNFDTNKKTSLLIATADLRNIYNSFRLAVSPFQVNSTSPLAGIKSCNYLENLLALENAKAENFDEAIRLNERGEVVSACMANIFWIKNNCIFTSALETGCLKGTIRSFILEKFPVEERRLDLSELLEAEDAFLTSSGLGVVKVQNINTVDFSDSSEIFSQVKSFFKDTVEK